MQTNFPSGPSFGATFDRDLIRSMANKVGVELRAMLALGDNKDNSWAHPSIDCWGPVVSSLNTLASTARASEPPFATRSSPYK